MPEKFKLSTEKAQPTLAIHTVATAKDLPGIMGGLFQKVYQYLVSLGEAPYPAAFACYHNMDPSCFEVDIGFLVTKPLPASREIFASEIPAGLQASCLHQGPYSEMERVYTGLMRWIADQDLQVAGPVFELYLNDLNQVSEQDLLTKIIVPVHN